MVGSIDHYRITGELGRGAAGAVFRAHDTRLDRPVAIKLLLEGGGQSELRRKRFEREALALSRVDHPNIVRIHGSGVHQGKPYLVMQLLEGTSLEERIAQSGPLNPSQAAWIVARLAEAMTHAHKLGVLHRDLKPSNVLLKSDGTPVLVDFGLAKNLQASTTSGALSASGSMLGTPHYWSPEQASGQREQIGPRSDVYGLGATLYAAITGEPPIEGDDLVEVLVATAKKPPTPPSDLRPTIHPELERITMRCLEKDPQDRYPTAAALAEELKRHLDGEPSDARRRSRPLRTPALVAGVALLLAGVAIAWATSGGGDPEPPPADVQPPAPPPVAKAPLPPADEPDEPADRSADARLEVDLGSMKFDRGDMDGALASFERAVRLDPNSALAHARRGAARASLGNRTGALEDFERAIQLDPGLAIAHYNRGAYFARAGDNERAMVAYNRAIDLDPTHAPSFNNRGMLRLNNNAFEAAREDFDEAIRLAPRYSAAYKNRAALRGRSGDTRGAIADCDRAIELNPRDSEAYHNRGVGKVAIGDRIGAAEDFERELSINPGHPEAANLRGYIRELRGGR